MKENKTNILIVGGGKGGTALVKMFRESATVNIVGVVDLDPDAPAVRMARDMGMAVGTDYKEFINKKGLDEVVNVTGSDKLQSELMLACPTGIEVVGGHTAKLMWSLVEEHEKAEKALRENEERIKTIISSVLTGIVIIDAETKKIVEANPAAEELIGAPREKIIGKTCHKFMCPAEEGKCPITDLGETVDRSEKILLKADGTEVPILKTVTEMTTGGRKYLIDSFVDISDRKKAEESIRLAHAELQQVFQSVGEGMCAVGRERNLVQINDTLLNLLGITREAAEGRKYSEIFSGELKRTSDEIFQKILDGEKRIERDVLVERRDGIKVSCILTVTPRLDARGKVVGAIGAFKDITERKSAEQALLENVRMKSNFTSMVSHELRTPLTAIREGIGIVLDGSTGPVNEEQKDFLSTAKRNVDRLSRLINDVLDFTKLKSGRMNIKIFEHDISEVIDEVIRTHLPLAEERGLSLKAKVSMRAPKAVFDSDRIIQVMTNLVNNALKFTEEGGVTVSAGVKGRDLLVSVEDTGPGIKKGDMPKLFQEFRQLEDEKSRKTGGTGLGLAISKAIIEQHGGRIWAESKPGKGTRFLFTLPLKKKYKIAVIDDEEGFHDFCDRTLRERGYEVLKATTGAEGIEKIRSERPDLVVLDMRLPDINGYEIIGHLRSEKDTSNIPLLAVSGFTVELEKLKGIKAAPEEKMTIPRLIKPFKKEDFLETIEILLIKARKGESNGW